MSACSTCRAPIRWVETEAGKAMPVDAEPTAHGNLTLHVVQAGASVRTVAVVVVPLLETAEERARPHYTSHFATCPQAAQHRRKQ